jgi:3-oxoacyl-(acyl-carrier-protein) synthase
LPGSFMPPDVFITGIGIVSPAGVGTEATWRGLLAGGRYVQTLQFSCACHDRGAPDLDLAGCATQFCAQVPSFTPPRGTENMDRVCQMAIVAAEEALGDAALLPAGGLLGSLAADPSRSVASDTAGTAVARGHGLDTGRTIVSVGTSKGGILTFADLAPLLTKTRHFASSPAYWRQTATREMLFSIPPDAPARCIAERFGIRGGVHTTVAACSTGTLAVIRGARFIEDRQADVVICGSADASLHKLWFAAFEQMGVLAPEHAILGPAWACRPFDRSRAGFALGEGAAILVLESGESARRRSVLPIARLAGAACGTDPAGLTQIGPDAEPLARTIRLACDRAGCQPEDITCVQAHGTATPANDRIESRAIRLALGRRAESVPIVSIKGAIGHLLGGAGSVELAVAALTCRDGISPGTATLIDPDPRLGSLSLLRGACRPARGPVLKTSLGFGGHLGAVVLTPV